MEIFEIDKKTANCGDSSNNYAISTKDPNSGAEFHELTVTITLAEYRELVSKAAVSDAELEKERAKLTEAERKLSEQIAETQALREALRASRTAETEG